MSAAITCAQAGRLGGIRRAERLSKRKVREIGRRGALGATKGRRGVSKPDMKVVKKKKQMTARQLANLRPAKRGEVRNPLGINRGRTYSDRYEEVALSPLPEKIRQKINE